MKPSCRELPLNSGRVCMAAAGLGFGCFVTPLHPQRSMGTVSPSFQAPFNVLAKGECD